MTLTTGEVYAIWRAIWTSIGITLIVITAIIIIYKVIKNIITRKSKQCEDELKIQEWLEKEQIKKDIADLQDENKKLKEEVKELKRKTEALYFLAGQKEKLAKTASRNEQDKKASK